MSAPLFYSYRDTKIFLVYVVSLKYSSSKSYMVVQLNAQTTSARGVGNVHAATPPSEVLLESLSSKLG